jgi:hypothetical protein
MSRSPPSEIPGHVVAGVTITTCLVLIAMGKNGTVTATLMAVIGWYFGRSRWRGGR